MEIHEKLKKMRKQANLTQDNLAELIHVSRQTISNWENGKSYPDLQSLLLLCKVYDISLSQLIEEDVVEMKRTVFKGKLYLFSFLLVSLITLLLVCISLIKHAGYFGFTLAGLSIIAIFLTSWKLEKIKKDLNLSNYKLIRNYLKNEE
ncbi:helix-turn-helix transcriptional regulator [Bacillus sp. BH2]|uniref:helix-turn-helix domain-containing protein n=1 Tax=Bacillus sp. BH2 TaxID=2528958 RepID=UPI001416F44D|nr:helix-turn-helix transcriptional regulator [Bacillus sp. BH2]